MKNSSIRVRFAPSPTGHLHIGGLRTALFNWLFAKHNNGTFLVRIEDTDQERSRNQYTKAILESLKWSGIASDEPIVMQTDRFDLYRQKIDELLQNGKAYKCFCSQEEVIARAKAKGADTLFVKYDGFCRSQKVERDASFVIRFALPHSLQELSFDDLIRARITFNRDQLDDLIIVRSDGQPLYNFVVVIDDIDMKMSHIIRGEDHISNTPKQILLYQAFNETVPQFAHIPLILGPSGNRLSKRDAATSVLEYRQDGYLPDALNNYLAKLGWSHEDQEIFSQKELVDLFTLHKVQKSGAVFDPKKLLWMNGVYIMQKKPVELLLYGIKNINPGLKDQLKGWKDERIVYAISLFQERSQTIKELFQKLIDVYTSPTDYDKDDCAKWIKNDTKIHLLALVDELHKLMNFEKESIEKIIKNYAKQNEIKFALIGQPLRIALLGSSSGPGVFDLLTLIGKTESLKRICALIKVIDKFPQSND